MENPTVRSATAGAPTISDPQPDQADDAVKRRTWLAAERTWLAWWRSGLSTGALAIAVGRLLPSLDKHGPIVSFKALGIGYAVLSVVTLVTGAIQQRRGAAALSRGDVHELSPRLVNYLTAFGVVLSFTGMVLLVTKL